MIWIFSVTIAIVLTAILIFNLHKSISNNPIVIYADDNPVPVTEIYFPAITFCPSLIFNKKSVKTVEYSALVKAIETQTIQINNLTMSE